MMTLGTSACPICGFDKPHTHTTTETALRETANANQRESMRKQAERQHYTAQLKVEFDLSPRQYAEKYGTINSVESSHLVQWLLERIDSVEPHPSQLPTAPFTVAYVNEVCRFLACLSLKGELPQDVADAGVYLLRQSNDLRRAPKPKDGSAFAPFSVPDVLCVSKSIVVGMDCSSGELQARAGRLYHQISKAETPPFRAGRSLAPGWLASSIEHVMVCG